MKQGNEASQTIREMTTLLDNQDIWLDVTAVIRKGKKATRDEIKMVVERSRMRHWMNSSALTELMMRAVSQYM